MGDWQPEALGLGKQQQAKQSPSEFPLCGSNQPPAETEEKETRRGEKKPNGRRCRAISATMRATFRLLAAVRPAARYLEPGTPTGLAGLTTHPSPRSTLLYLYSTTLEKLKAVPEHSVYRQSVEALTKHRMGIVESVVPPGYDEWAAKARKLLSEHPEFEAKGNDSVDGARAIKVERGGRAFVVRRIPQKEDMRYEEWDGEKDEGSELEGSRTLEEKQDLKHIFGRQDISDADHVEFEPEPQLTADQ